MCGDSHPDELDVLVHREIILREHALTVGDNCIIKKEKILNPIVY